MGYSNVKHVAMKLFPETTKKTYPRKFNNVLVIDDEEIDLFLVENILLESNLSENIIYYSNAKHALSYLEKIRDPSEFPDLIILDLNMPVFNGEDFLMSYHRAFPNGMRATKVVVLTAYKHFHEARHISSQRFPPLVKIIEKPLQVKELVGV